MNPHPILDEVETRVLGSLIEKDTTTPDYYPLSLNALVNACNQKSNREPVMNLDNEAARAALQSLSAKGLAAMASSADSRVPKYEHRMQEVFNLPRAETAVLCVLLLRGPQTPGELRSRTERMYRFEDLSDVQSALQHLIERDPPLVKVLPRQPGTKESRYVHLLSGEVEFPDTPAAAAAHAPAHQSDDGERITNLEREVGSLKEEIAELKNQLANFRKQFE